MIAIEPWFMAGGNDDYAIDDDGWTIRSADGSRAAHVEHTVAVTRDGPVVLTARDAGGCARPRRTPWLALRSGSGSCPADGAAPPCGPVRRTMTRPPAATLVNCACHAPADKPGRHRAPRTTVPLRDVRLPPFPASRLPGSGRSRAVRRLGF